MSLVVIKRGVGSDSGANSGWNGLHSPGGAPGVPRDGAEEEEGRGPLQARQTGGHQPQAPAGQHAEDPSRGETHLVGREL